MDSGPDSIFDPSPSFELLLVEDLLDDIATSPQDVPVHDWQKDELDRRQANLRQNPASRTTWDEVVARIRNRHGR